MTLYTATITLLLVMDPLGNIPVFLSILNSANPQRRQWIILRESLIALGILVIFLFFGKYILEGMQISESALGVAGGIILFLISIRMIFPHDDEKGPRPKHIGEPFIVPLAIPLVAGPSTMTVIMLLASKDPEKMTTWTIALFIAWLITTIVLVFADQLRKILRDRGLIAIERLMGMILTTMSVQMFLTGVANFYHL